MVHQFTLRIFLIISVYSTSFTFAFHSPIQSFSSRSFLFANLPENNNNNDELMKFGHAMDISLKLPCRDFQVANAFLSDTDGLMEALWEQNKFKRLANNHYLLIMNPITFPGFDVITPEIEVCLLLKLEFLIVVIIVFR